MTTEDVLAEFKEAGALLEGHFILSSGLRSPVFLQKALVFRDAARTERLCKALADALKAAGHGPFTAIVSPAMGGIIPGYETARHLGVPSMYVEREGGTFKLRRGFQIEPGQKVLMVEDVVTTGLSSREAIAAVAREGGEVIAEVALVDRSDDALDLGVPFFALLDINFPTFADDELPEELAAIPITKPGSRKV